jgi:hypothetical protein
LKNETISKSLSTDEKGGVFIVSDYALYRFTKRKQTIMLSWRFQYDRGSRIKPGQNQQGCGTTPTCFNDSVGGRFVTIADNADPFLNILVLHRDSGILCAKQPVFSQLPFRNACENSLIAVNRSVIVENNYGNVNVKSTAGRATTEPGIARVDFDPDTKASSVVWENYGVAIPSVVTQMSTANSLIYTYAKDAEGWYFAGLDYVTGDILVTKRVGRSSLLNNFYAGIGIGPDHNVYLSVFFGIVAWKNFSDRQISEACPKI